MQFPAEIRIAAEEHASGFGMKELSKAAAAISEKYREEKGDGSRLVTKAAEAAAYAVVRMPATFAAVSTALGHTLRHFSGGISSVTDIGAGTGAGIFACAELFEDLERALCLERENEMRRLGKDLAEAGGLPFPCEWRSLDITKDELPESSDLVMASYVLNELTPSQRDDAVRMMWEHTDRLLLLIEPGTMAGATNIKRARSLLISMGASIAAPCPAVSECSMSSDDWCHFTARAARSKLHKQLKGGEVPYEDEKFSFIAAVRGDCEPCERRILRHPSTESGMITLHVCSADGISDMKITRSSPLFKAARKASCGDSI